LIERRTSPCYRLYFDLDVKCAFTEDQPRPSLRDVLHYFLPSFAAVERALFPLYIGPFSSLMPYPPMRRCSQTFLAPQAMIRAIGKTSSQRCLRVELADRSPFLPAPRYSPFICLSVPCI
jgi:hypothetical protein